MAELDLNGKDDEYKVKIMDSGEYKEPGGGIRKPTQEEIDAYSIHRIVVMIVFGLVVVALLLIIIIMIATVDRCEPKPELPWWKTGVMYNIYPRSFKDSAKDDGIGDFKGIMDKLDYLKDLGVEILYLSSVFKVNKSSDYGYAVVDFKDTNEDYGSLSDFEKLVDAAHKKDLKVIIEYIPNDTSDQHKWFKESMDVNGDKRNWYIWRDDVSKIKHKGTDSCWKKEPSTGKFYLYYCKWGNDTGKADLNWANPAVQDEMESVLGFWLDKGVDGFRVVSVARIFDNLSPPPSNDFAKISAMLSRWHNYTTKKNRDSILIGASHEAGKEYYKTDLDIVINFRLVPENNADMKKFYTAENFKNLITAYLSDGPKWPNWALTSWVHKRVASNLASTKLVKSLNVLLLTLPGTPIVFYGDEIGMTDVTSASHPRDGNKSPMQWNNEKYGGFSANRPWFGIVGNYAKLNAKEDQHGIKKAFQDAAKLRSENELSFLNVSLKNFTTTVLGGSVLAYTFKPEAEDAPQFIVAINFGSDKKTVDLHDLGEVEKGEVELPISDEKPKLDLKNVEVAAEDAIVIKIIKEKD